MAYWPVTSGSAGRASGAHTQSAPRCGPHSSQSKPTARAIRPEKEAEGKAVPHRANVIPLRQHQQHRGAQDAARGQKPAQCPLWQHEMSPGTRSAKVQKRATPSLPQAIACCGKRGQQQKEKQAQQRPFCLLLRVALAQPLPGQNGQGRRVAGTENERHVHDRQ